MPKIAAGGCSRNPEGARDDALAATTLLTGFLGRHGSGGRTRIIAEARLCARLQRSKLVRCLKRGRDPTPGDYAFFGSGTVSARAPNCHAKNWDLRKEPARDSIISMLDFIKFWGRSLWSALRGGWVVFATMSTLLPVVISLIQRHSPTLAAIPLIKWVAENQAEIQIWIAALFLIPYLLYAPYRFYKEQGKELSDLKSQTNSQREIAERLGEFLAKGEHWKSVCRNPKGDIFPGDRMAEWRTELESYVTAKLGQSYHARLVSNIGITDFPVGVPEKYRANWIYINIRCARLHEFIKELSQSSSEITSSKLRT